MDIDQKIIYNEVVTGFVNLFYTKGIFCDELKNDGFGLKYAEFVLIKYVLQISLVRRYNGFLGIYLKPNALSTFLIMYSV